MPGYQKGTKQLQCRKSLRVFSLTKLIQQLFPLRDQPPTTDIHASPLVNNCTYIVSHEHQIPSSKGNATYTYPTNTWASLPVRKKWKKKPLQRGETSPQSNSSALQFIFGWLMSIFIWTVISSQSKMYTKAKEKWVWRLHHPDHRVSNIPTVRRSNCFL